MTDNQGRDSREIPARAQALDLGEPELTVAKALVMQAAAIPSADDIYPLVAGTLAAHSHLRLGELTDAVVWLTEQHETVSYRALMDYWGFTTWRAAVLLEDGGERLRTVAAELVYWMGNIPGLDTLREALLGRPDRRRGPLNRRELMRLLDLSSRGSRELADPPVSIEDPAFVAEVLALQNAAAPIRPLAPEPFRPSEPAKSPEPPKPPEPTWRVLRITDAESDEE